MLTLQRLLTLIIMYAGVACHSSDRLLDSHANQLRDARGVATAFYASYGAQVGLTDIPFVTLGVESGTGYAYAASHNVLFVTPYAQADFDTQRLFTRACKKDRAAAVYDELMFRFFTAHELMHLTYERLSVPASLTKYEEETRINAMTWLFLEEAGLLPANIREQTAALADLHAELAPRFSRHRGEQVHASALEVDDNASYWYVTTASIAEAQQLAHRARSQQAYVMQLTNTTPAVAPAEATGL